MAKESAIAQGKWFVSLRKLLDGATGARLCFGEPVEVGDRKVIPVARIEGAGGAGGGFGEPPAAGPGQAGGGGGGGGWVNAAPVGFIEVSSEGTRYETIPDPTAHARMIRAWAGAAVTIAGAVRGWRAVRRGGGAGRRALRRPPAALLPSPKRSKRR